MSDCAGIVSLNDYRSLKQANQDTEPLTGLGWQRVSQDSFDSPALVRLGKGESFRQAGKGRENSQHLAAAWGWFSFSDGKPPFYLFLGKARTRWGLEPNRVAGQKPIIQC